MYMCICVFVCLVVAGVCCVGRGWAAKALGERMPKTRRRGGGGQQGCVICYQIKEDGKWFSQSLSRGKLVFHGNCCLACGNIYVKANLGIDVADKDQAIKSAAMIEWFDDASKDPIKKASFLKMKQVDAGGDRGFAGSQVCTDYGYGFQVIKPMIILNKQEFEDYFGEAPEKVGCKLETIHGIDSVSKGFIMNNPKRPYIEVNLVRTIGSRHSEMFLTPETSLHAEQGHNTYATAIAAAEKGGMIKMLRNTTRLVRLYVCTNTNVCMPACIYVCMFVCV